MSKSVAIVGGGLAGSFCALIARSRGLRPVIFDAGRRGPGGRFAGGAAPGTGAQFLRASVQSQFSHVLDMLAREGLVAPWEGRFGVLGTRGGGFLPLQVLRDSAVLASPDCLDASGDFCSFMRSSHATTFVGTPSNANVCAGLCAAIGAELHVGVDVTAARFDTSRSCWSLEHAGAQRGATYDALVLATHNPSLGAATVRSLLQVGTGDKSVDERLGGLAHALQAQRDLYRTPVYSLSARFPLGVLSRTLPFDAVTVPGSAHLQFIAREASKPGRTDDADGELWSSISSTRFAVEVQRDPAMGRGDAHAEAAAAAEALSLEMRQLCAPFFGGDVAAVPQPLRVHAKRWGAAFAAQTLGLNEDSVGLEPWRLVICGDFVRSHPSPIEAAALSGLDAGEKVAAFLA